MENSELSKRIKDVLNELYSIQEQDQKPKRCNPEEIQKVLSILEASNNFQIKIYDKNKNYLSVDDGFGKLGCLVKRNEIFKI